MLTFVKNLSVMMYNALLYRCPFTVFGHHEPNVILKDNDLKHKIRLPSDVANKILAQLRKDAEFLCRSGIMDYSLLVGVHNTEYEVEDEGLSRHDESLISTESESEDIRETAKFDKQMNSALKRRASVRSVVTNSNTTGHDSRIPSSTGSAASSMIGPTGGRLQVSRVVGPKAYYIGIVDYQQKWDLNKKVNYNIVF